MAYMVLFCSGLVAQTGKIAKKVPAQIAKESETPMNVVGRGCATASS